MGTARHLFGRLSCGASAQVSLRASAASLFPSSGAHQPTLLAAGYEVFKIQEVGTFIPLTSLTVKVGVVRTKILKIIYFLEDRGALLRPYAGAC